jgi:hypothetical protein
MSADEVTPETPEGFVRMTHDDLGATCEVPLQAQALHEARGWHVVADQSPPAPPPPTAP